MQMAHRCQGIGEGRRAAPRGRPAEPNGPWKGLRPSCSIGPPAAEPSACRRPGRHPTVADRQARHWLRSRTGGSMNIDKAIKWFMPKEERFHELLERATKNLVHGAQVFSEIAHATSLEDAR